MNEPQRGDVMVFRYPANPSLDYIKRVVGLPGDEVAYRNKRLTINGSEVQVKRGRRLQLRRTGLSFVSAQRFIENARTRTSTRSSSSPRRRPCIRPACGSFPCRENCDYNDDGFTCKVPPGHYFMMGDNRDNSDDSRYWGFVPEANIVGKAFFIWLNFDDFRRIGRFIDD